jgi:nicotinamide riboside kinase
VAPRRFALTPDAASGRTPAVVAIGGGASVGKTTVATQLAHRLAVPLVHVEAIRAAIEAERPSFGSRAQVRAVCVIESDHRHLRDTFASRPSQARFLA